MKQFRLKGLFLVLFIIFLSFSLLCASCTKVRKRGAKSKTTVNSVCNPAKLPTNTNIKVNP
ncbi:MAG: hypothetical protein RLZZ628_755 [Bacteroidota bacterium]